MVYLTLEVPGGTAGFRFPPSTLLRVALYCGEEQMNLLLFVILLQMVLSGKALIIV